MWSRFLRRFVFTSAIAALLVCVMPRVAHAQAAISIFTETSIPRVDASGKTIGKRSLQLTPEGVSYQDCINNIQIQPTIQLANFEANASLQVWAGPTGEDCSQVTDRSGIAATCWRVHADLALQLSQTITIPVRSIMSGALGINNLDSSVGICGKVDLTTVSVNFIYFSPGNTSTPSASHQLAVQVDTIGPSAPTGLSALPGNTRLEMKWDNISGEGGVSALTGIRVYCDPVHSTTIPSDPKCKGFQQEQLTNLGLVQNDAGVVSSATDAGTDAGTTGTSAVATSTITLAGSNLASSSTSTPSNCTTTTTANDAGDDGGDAGTTSTTTCTDAGDTSVGAIGGTCTSDNLVAANSAASFIPDDAFNACFGCGSITGNTGTSIVASDVRGTPLVNNTRYALAVAATDAFGNVGPLSPLQCEYPEITTDFWENYKDAGGHAGGGCDTTESPAGSIGALVGAIAIVGSMIRRRRNRS
jgi:hypothetical protein